MPMRNVVLPREVAERIRQVLRDVRETDDTVTLLAVQSDAGIVAATLAAVLAVPEPFERTNDEFSRIHVPALKHHKSFTLYRSHPKRTDIRQEICLQANSYGSGISSYYMFDVEARAVALALLEITEPAP